MLEGNFSSSPQPETSSEENRGDFEKSQETLNTANDLEQKESLENISLDDIFYTAQELEKQEDLEEKKYSEKTAAILAQINTVDDFSAIVFKAIEQRQFPLRDFPMSIAFWENSILRHIQQKSTANFSQEMSQLYHYRKTFLQNFFDHIDKKRDATKSPQDFYDFLDKSYPLFEGSPNMVDNIGSFFDSLEVASKIRSIPELKDEYFILIQGLTIDLNFSEKDFEKNLVESLNQFSPFKQFFIIRTLQEVARSGFASGYAKHLPKKISTIFRQNNSPSALLKIATDTFLLTPMMQQKSNIFDQKENLLEFIKIPGSFAEQYKPAIISKDTFGLFDVYDQVVYTYPRQDSRETIPESSVTPLSAQFPDLDPEHLTLFQELHQPEVRDIIENELGISLTEISLHSQIWLLKYLAESDTVRYERLKRAIGSKESSIQKANLLESFLSIEQGGPEMGEKILSIAENLPQDIADRIFAKYGEMVDMVDDMENYLATQFSSFQNSNQTAQNLSRLLLKRGKEMLIRLAVDTSDSEKALRKLDQYKFDIILAKDTFRSLYEQGVITKPNDMIDMTFETSAGGSFSEEVGLKLVALYEESMKKKNYPEANQSRLLEKFRENLANPQSLFPILQWKGRIIGFLCFSPYQDGLLVSSLNLTDEFQGANKISDAMLHAAVNEKSKETILFADCVAHDPISSRYIEEYEFAAHRSWLDNGALILDISRDDKSKHRFQGKSLSKSGIKDRYERKTKDDALRIERTEKISQHNFSLCNQGYALTRYFRSEEENAWFFVYEKQESETRDAIEQ